MRTYSGYQDNNGKQGRPGNRGNRMMLMAVGVALAAFFIIQIMGNREGQGFAETPYDLHVRITFHAHTPPINFVMPPLPWNLTDDERFEATVNFAHTLLELYDARIVRITFEGEEIEIFAR